MRPSGRLYRFQHIFVFQIVLPVGSVRLGPLGAGWAHWSEVTQGGGRIGGIGVSLPEHGVGGLGGAGEGARAVVQGGLIQRGRGQHNGARLTADQRLNQTALRGPGPVVPAVLPQAVRQRGDRRGAGSRTGTTGTGGDRRGARGAWHWGPNNWEVVVLLHVVQTLDWDS